MTAGVKNIIIEQGATFIWNLTWKDSNGSPIDLSSYTARMQVRKNYNASDTLLSLTSVAGDIVLGGAAGTIAITATATMTSEINSRVGVYDLELISPTGTVKRLLQGDVTINPEVTR